MLTCAQKIILSPKPLVLALTGVYLMMPIAAYAANDTTPSREEELSDIDVYGDRNSRNEAGQDKVYELDMSTVYRDRKQLDDFRGASPADIYKGVVGVFSGDARNSGALDTNIRGVQGQERVPVIVDGTKQAITVWRGYNGANNRNYIDPLLISGMSIEKGPSLTRDVQGSLGGAVVINTLNVDDIIKPGEKWGIDITGEVASNTTKHRAYRIEDYVGKNWFDLPRDLFPVENNPNMPSGVAPQMTADNATWQKPKTKGGGLQGQDQTYRIAAALKTDYADFLAAYVYRNRGNYFAGKGGWHNYYDPAVDQGKSGDLKGYNFTTYMANLYQPEKEVFNTSERTKSWLLKAKIKPTAKQSLELGWRRNDSNFGDILPSRVANSSVTGVWAKEKNKERLPQWPLSRVKLDAYNLEYKWQPENKWFDVSANAWTTRADTELNSTGGWPILPVQKGMQYILMAMQPYDFGLCARRDDFVCASEMAQKYFPMGMEEMQNNPNNATIYSDSQLFTRNNRWGLTASNKMRLTERLDLTAGAAYQHEKLMSDDAWMDDPLRRTISKGITFGWFAWPRQGKRQEWEGSLRFDWRPTDQWDVTLGSKYNRYTSEDLLINKRRAKHDISFADQRYVDADGAIDERAWQPAQKAKASGWSPLLSTSYRFNNDYSRVYMRLAQQVRMPTLFETTTGFSMMVANTEPVKPERGTNIELGYVHDLRQWLPRARHANIKLAYYHNTIKDVIDRSDVDTRLLRAVNMEKQKTSGIEIQSRYDNGRFFSDFSLGYMLKNEVCDKEEARNASRLYHIDVPTCVPNGFNGGYLQNMALPKLTADLVLGGRFMNERLELGTRLHYHSKPINNGGYAKTYGDSISWSVTTMQYNVPLEWKPVTTVDAYLNYKIGKDITATVAGTNLTNRYYLDPLTRTLMPAPGRALRVGLKAKF